MFHVKGGTGGRSCYCVLHVSMCMSCRAATPLSPQLGSLAPHEPLAGPHQPLAGPHEPLAGPHQPLLALLLDAMCWMAWPGPASGLVAYWPHYSTNSTCPLTGLM